MLAGSTEIALRLGREALSKLESDPLQATVGLRQALELERRFGTDGERLCKAASMLCRALAKVPGGLIEAVSIEISAIDEIEQRTLAASAASNGTQGAASPRKPGVLALSAEAEEHRDFLARELLGLARTLSGSADGRSARLDELRAADRAYERLAQLTKEKPLRIGSTVGIVLTQEELFFQLADTAQRIGMSLLRLGSARDQEAACFYLQRAARKLRLAGLREGHARVREVRALIETAEGKLRATHMQVAPSTQPKTPHGGHTAAVAADATAAEACAVQ